MTTYAPRINKLQRLAEVLAGAVVLLGLMVLLGWWFGIPAFKSVLPGSVTMKANTALCFVLTGLSLFLVASGKPDRGWKKSVSTACAGGAVLISLLTLLEYALGWELHIDQLLAGDLALSPATSYPGRMAPHTAVCFFLFGVALLTLERKTQLVGWPAQYFAIIAGLISVAGLLGYIYGQRQFYGWQRYGMAIHTALGFTLLTLGVLASRPDSGLMASITRDSAGGLMARRLLLPTVALPVLLGWLTMAGHRAGYYELAFAAALLALGSVLLLAGLVGATTVALNRAEARQHQGEEERIRLSVSQEATRVQAEALRFLAESSAVLATSLDYRTTLSKIAHLVVPRLGDWCVVDMLEGDGVIRQVALAHVDHSQEALAQSLAERHPTDPEAATGVAHVLRTGQPIIHPDLAFPEELAEALGADHPEILRTLGARSYIIIPLAARGRTLGAITFVYAQSGRRFSPTDLTLATDLGQRAAIAVDNARLYHEAREAVRTREEVLAVVSHDLKNPLGAIHLSANLLTRAAPEDELGARIRRHAETIQRSSQRMERLIRDLLDLASLREGKLSIERREHPVGPLIDEALSLLGPLAVEKSLEFQAQVRGRQTRLLCDPERIFQVLSNLVGNALKFTPAPGRVEVRAAPQESEVLFAIQDTGPGIPRDRLPHIFEPYWQARETARHGTGLGLYIARGIVEAHGGRLWVESEPGHGSTFFFTLPTAGGGEATLHG
jgi:signal transduction histidine kinase